MQKILILHHFSDYWSEGLSKYGTTFEKEIEKVIDYLEHEDIDKVILPLFEQHELEDCHYPLAEYCQSNGIELDVHEYNYAWSKESDHNADIYTEENFNKTWCYGTREGHGEDDVVEIEEWQHDLKNNDVIVAGSFAGECVLDLTTALDAIEVEYEREEGLIVGSYVEYEFRGQTIEEIVEEIHEKLDKIDDKVSNKIADIENEYSESISDIDELHIFSPNFVESIEDEINELFDEYEEILETKNIMEPLGCGYISDISSEVFSQHEHSCEYQDIPDEHLEKMIEVRIRKIEHDYEDFTEINSIEELIQEDKEIAKQYFEEIDDMFELLKEEFDISDIENINIESLTTNTITDDYWIDYLLKDKKLNIETLSFLQQKNAEEHLKGEFYHGTNWTFDLNSKEKNNFIELDRSYSSLDVVYITQEEQTANWFVKYSMNRDADLQIPVVFKYENVDINKIYNIQENMIKNEYLNKKTFKYEGVNYDLQDDRESYFRDLEVKYNGVMLKNNYNDLGGGDDIALFDEDLINENISGVKLFIDNKWTEYVTPEEAIELYDQEVKKVVNQSKKRKLKIG